MSRKLIYLDCDSTLSAIEGIDELARLRGPDVFEECVQMTNRAMDGHIPLESVYGERLKLIRPTRAECVELGQRYIETVEPHAMALVKWLKDNGWEPIILSGGITQIIEPFAEFLGINKIEAVDLIFDEKDAFMSHDETCPTSRMGGKIEIIEAAKAAAPVELVVEVGDGVSDLETRDVVDLFIGFGAYVERSKVKEGAEHFVMGLDAVPALLQSLTQEAAR